MGVNQYKPHVLVLPEDDANSSLANGFHLELGQIRQMQVLEVAGGWNEVLTLFESVHAAEMDRCRHRLMVLLIDFDGRESRLRDAKARIPTHLTDRVFILGSRTEPEDLKPDFGSLETVGRALGRDCRTNTNVTWSYKGLRHNASELDRLRELVRPILFP